MADVKEKDWKEFRKRVPGWQMAYMQKLEKEYLELLQSGKPADQIFWALQKRIEADRKSPGVIVEMRRSRMMENLITMMLDGVITPDDLSGFSDEIRDSVGRWHR